MSRLSGPLSTVFGPMTRYDAHALSFGRVTTARKQNPTNWDEKRGTIEDPRIFCPDRDDCCACSGGRDGTEVTCGVSQPACISFRAGR
jgi:hypothetical protein